MPRTHASDGPAARKSGAVGIEFGEYRLLRRLGAGGMAEVFLAKKIGPKGFEKQLVIKRILPHLTKSERFIQLFLNEARLAALIDHPNLVHVSGFGEIDGNYYLAMEYVDGTTVSDLLELAGTLTPGVACRIAIDLLGALQAIHSAKDDGGRALGLVHRDISPRNVMLTRDGTVKLLDFGIAVSKDDVENAALMGTRSHMSPEQMRGDALDARSDLFCVAVLVYQMITGRAPFEGSSFAMPPRPESFSDALWSAVERTLSIKPDVRPASARALQAELELFVASRGIEGTRAHLADVVTAIVPEGRPPAARALSRFTQRTMTRILRLTTPLSPEEELAEAEAGAGASERAKSRAVAIRLALLMLAAMTLGGAMVLAGRWIQTPNVEVAPPVGVAPPPVEAEVAVAEPARVATATPAASVTAAPVPVAPKQVAKKRETGMLTIDTRPWSEVYLGDRKLGLTPMEGVRLPSGKHELELRNPSLGIVRKIQVTIRPGKTTRVQRAL